MAQAHYIYQTVATVTADDDPSKVIDIAAVGGFVASAVKARVKPTVAGAAALAPDDRRPYRFTPDGAEQVARFRVEDSAVLTRWAGTPDASERLTLLVSTGIAPTFGASPISPTVAELATMKSVGRETFAAMLASGGFARPTARGSKAAATAAESRKATAEERTAAALDTLFADADAPAIVPDAADAAPAIVPDAAPKSRKSRD